DALDRNGRICERRDLEALGVQEILEVLADVLIVVDDEHRELRRHAEWYCTCNCNCTCDHGSDHDSRYNEKSCRGARMGPAAVGARGFEPPTPWSRTKCATRLRYAP